MFWLGARRSACEANDIIDIDIDARLGSLDLSARFSSAGGVTALFGPSGAGKTTLINMIAGLLKPERGHIRLTGDTLFDSAQGIHIPAHRRRIGYVFQDARLFPHLNVRRNLDYGRRMNGLAPDALAFSRVTQMLDIGGLLERRTARLSGGERQRVALGRALLCAPRLLLLDEPLASLDAERKNDILPYLVRLRDETSIPMIYVSHDPVEARRIATQVVLLDHGQVQASGGIELLDETRP